MPRGVYPRTEEHNRKISEALMGIPLADETRLKMSKAHKGKPSPMKGIPLSEKHKHRMSEAKMGKPSGMKGKHHTDETKQEMSKALVGIPKSDEAKRKMRLSTIRRKQIIPNYNPRACKYFDFINRLTNIEGQHALCGGEFLIEELGYYVDYYNPELKMIIEWDEPRHYNSNGNLKLRDVRRQKEIQEVYPDFTFTRVKQ